MKKLIFVFISLVSILTVVGCAVQSPAPIAPKNTIEINYTYVLMPDELWLGTLPRIPGSGTSNLIVNLTIDNHGYDSFEANKSFFSVVAKGISYPDTDCYVADALSDSNVQNGGTLNGAIPFAVPSMTNEFTMKYIGPGSYNIKWIEHNNMG